MINGQVKKKKLINIYLNSMMKKKALNASYLLDLL